MLLRVQLLILLKATVTTPLYLTAKSLVFAFLCATSNTLELTACKKSKTYKPYCVRVSQKNVVRMFLSCIILTELIVFMR